MEGKIELLPKKPPPKAKAVVVSVARLIGIPFIILIQTIFLILLGFHLKLEQDLTTLSSSIGRKEGVLAQAAETETLFRSTQSKLEIIATIREGFCYSCAFKVIKRITPPLVTLTGASLKEESLSFTADTPQGLAFARFVTNLLEEESVEEAAITSGILNEKEQLTFTMELSFNKEKLKR